MAGKKGAKKTVGRARKDAGVKQTLKLSYVKKPNGAYQPQYEVIDSDDVGEKK